MNQCSCAPLWMTWLSALAVPAVAALGAFIAWRQWRTARNKLKLDLFERRLSIHKAARDVIAAITSRGAVTQEEMFAFLSGIQQSRWLLDKGICGYLEQKFWRKLCVLNELNATQDAPDVNLQHNILQQTELRTWFAEERDHLDSMFDRFLRMP